MNGQEFDALVIKFTDEVRDTLITKGTEYVPSGQKEVSRFHNFEISAAFNQQHSTEALWGFLTKHLVSLGDMVKKDSRAQPMEVWDEKLGDAMAYLILLKGIVTENEQKQGQTVTIVHETPREPLTIDLDGHDINVGSKAPRARDRIADGNSRPMQL